MTHRGSDVTDMVEVVQSFLCVVSRRFCELRSDGVDQNLRCVWSGAARLALDTWKQKRSARRSRGTLTHRPPDSGREVPGTRTDTWLFFSAHGAAGRMPGSETRNRPEAGSFRDQLE